MEQLCCGEGNFRLSVPPAILYLYSFCKGKTVQNSPDPAPTWLNIFSSSHQLVSRLVHVPLAVLPDPRKPEQSQTHDSSSLSPRQQPHTVQTSLAAPSHAQSCRTLQVQALPSSPDLSQALKMWNFVTTGSHILFPRAAACFYAETPANPAAAGACRLLRVAKGLETMASSPCGKKESPAEPSENLVSRLDCLSMMYHKSITLSSGLSKQEEFGSEHTSRRERAGWVGEPAPSPIPHGHREGGREGDGLLGTGSGCVLTAPGNGAGATGPSREPERWAPPYAGERWGDRQGMDNWSLFSIGCLSSWCMFSTKASPASSCGVDPTNSLTGFSLFLFFLPWISPHALRRLVLRALRAKNISAVLTSTHPLSRVEKSSAH